jgi:Na+/H+-dicarboxylate symporter
MIHSQTNNLPGNRRPWYRPSLTTQILIGLVLGGVLGYISPKWGNNVYFLRDIFLNLIKSIMRADFSTLVVGIAAAAASRSGAWARGQYSLLILRPY